MSLWQDPLDLVAQHEVRLMRFNRSYRTSILQSLGSSRRKSQVQAVLILLVESGLVFLVFQVSHFYILLMRVRKILTALTVLTDGGLGFVSSLSGEQRSSQFRSPRL